MEFTTKVCVVDDDSAVRASLDALLRSVGLEVELYSSAVKFLEGYRADGPACLLLDVRLRGMSGLELQEELAVRNVAIPIIFITAHGEVSAAVRALRNGAFDFLEKPYSHTALLDRVWQALDKVNAPTAPLRRRATSTNG